jgi:hypothetical protein
MKIGNKVKIISSFNADLINKVATITGSRGSTLEVMLDGRESMRYDVHPGNCIDLSEPVKEPVVDDVESVKKSIELLEAKLAKKKETLKEMTNG